MTQSYDKSRSWKTDNKTEIWQTMLQMNCSPVGLIQLFYCHVSWGTHSKRSGWSSLFRCRVVSLSHYMVVWLPCLHANWHFGGIFCRFWAKYYVSIQIYISSISLFVINWGGSLSWFNPGFLSYMVQIELMSSSQRPIAWKHTPDFFILYQAFR